MPSVASPPATIQELAIDLGERSYPIALGTGLIGASSTWSKLPAAGAALVVTNSTVAPLYLDRLLQGLRGRFPAVHQVVLPDGERHKDWPTLNLVFDALLSNGCDRKTVL